MPTADAEVTRILAAPTARAAEELLPLVYEQLRKIAQIKMSGERADHTLQATALVHEAYARLVGNNEVAWENRAHFFVAAGEAMRRILIEHARSRNALKRGGVHADTAGVEVNARAFRVPLDAVEMAKSDDPAEIVSVDEAVLRLTEVDAELGRVVRLRFYSGLTEEETARVLGVSDRTVRRSWSLARAWLHREIAGETGDDEK